MTNAPLFEDPRYLKQIAEDPEITAIISRTRRQRLAAGLALLAVLAVILLMSIFE